LIDKLRGLNMSNKKELLLNMIFEIFKIIFTVELTLLAGVVLKVAFEPQYLGTGLKIGVIEIFSILLILWFFGIPIFYLYKNID